MGSVVVVPGLWSTCSLVLAYRLDSCMACGDLPWPRIESVSLALSGGLFTTEPPGKLLKIILYQYSCVISWFLYCCCCPVSKLCLTLCDLMDCSLSFTISWNLLKLMPIVLLMPSNHLILCHPLFLLLSIFPKIRVFSNELAFFASGGQSIEDSASTSVLPMNIQGWFPLGLTGLIFLLSK